MIDLLMSMLRSSKQNERYYKKLGLKIGRYCEILNGWNFGSEPYLIALGDYVRVAAGVRFITHDGGVWVLRHRYPSLKDVDLLKPIRVGNNVHIGMNAIIMPGVTIGDNCIIGCSAVVTHDVPDDSVAVGIPARVIENIDEYREKNERLFLHTKGMSGEEKRKTVERAMATGH
ncbi:acyltransferase [Bifidobacterium platyrrhinorum]|uniref:Acyltransferase n=1 Tax=Bifidobacterium platyrrhinorum TaxID=2661628 RepID=A0A6L9SRM9_9BIFI|nr:acyltransferase [Bifidobacterium platyrrhinorum]NEG55144.1 acyltransferase [Bifidobacterium platyrrhinorum]